MQDDLGPHPGELAESFGKEAVVTDRQTEAPDVGDLESDESIAGFARFVWLPGKRLAIHRGDLAGGRDRHACVVDAPVGSTLVDRARHEPEAGLDGDLGEPVR